MAKNPQNSLGLSWWVKIKDRRYYWLRKYKQAKGCENCGYNEHFIALDFAHIDPITKSEETITTGKAGGMTRLIRKIYKDKRKREEALTNLIKEVRKCKILCKNCHQVETYIAGEMYGTELGKKRKQLKNPAQPTLEEFFK
jgi:predicted nucleic-acid-binding Zn-ribbon protein